MAVLLTETFKLFRLKTLTVIILDEDYSIDASWQLFQLYSFLFYFPYYHVYYTSRSPLTSAAIRFNIIFR
jgi:hypothetical protein